METSGKQSSVLDTLDWKRWGYGEGQVTDEAEIAQAALRRLPNSVDIAKAVTIAVAAHHGQFRDKGTEKNPSPYVIHPLAVAIGFFEMMVKGGVIHKDGELVKSRDPVKQKVMMSFICSAILHDVFEDCDPVYRNMVISEFSPEVPAYVMLLTKRDDAWFKSLSRKDRKMFEYSHYYSTSPVAKFIKLCDRLHNLYSWPLSDKFAYGPNSELLKESEKLLTALAMNISPDDVKIVDEYFRDMEDRINYMRGIDISLLPK